MPILFDLVSHPCLVFSGNMLCLASHIASVIPDSSWVDCSLLSVRAFVPWPARSIRLSLFFFPFFSLFSECLWISILGTTETRGFVPFGCQFFLACRRKASSFFRSWHSFTLFPTRTYPCLILAMGSCRVPSNHSSLYFFWNFWVRPPRHSFTPNGLQ